MRIRTRKNLKRKNTIITLLFLLPLIGFGAYAGFALYILDDVASFTLNLEPPNTDYFYNLDNILGNSTYLEKMATSLNHF